MKSILTLMMVLVMSLWSAEAFKGQAKGRGYHAIYTAQKPLVVGHNTWQIRIEKGNMKVQKAAVQVKVFMPAMPGMPYMEYVADAKEIEKGIYEVELNFSMGGTWQVHVLVEEEGKKSRLKGSINL